MGSSDNEYYYRINMTAFEPQVPSIFSIDSPFQALCAIAAIRQLHIDDYMILAYFKKDEVRNAQMNTILKKFKVRYKKIRHFNRFTFTLAKWSALRMHHMRYLRLFIGDYRDIMLYYSGLRYVSDGADIIYLDDGNATISLLKGIVNNPFKEDDLLFFKNLQVKRGIIVNRNILTIYDKIKNSKYIVEPLNLNLIVPTHNDTPKSEGIYVVGTYMERYCEVLGIPVDIYQKKLEELIARLCQNSQGEKVVFVPHGRDKSEYVKMICSKYGATFEPSEMTIELKLLYKPFPPKIVYGFTSSALFNIKKIFPKTKVVNMLYECKQENPYYQGYRLTSEYYSQNGIELELNAL